MPTVQWSKPVSKVNVKNILNMHLFSMWYYLPNEKITTTFLQKVTQNEKKRVNCYFLSRFHRRTPKSIIKYTFSTVKQLAKLAPKWKKDSPQSIGTNVVMYSQLVSQQQQPHKKERMCVWYAEWWRICMENARTLLYSRTKLRHVSYCINKDL